MSSRSVIYAISAFIVLPVLCFSQSQSDSTVVATRKAAVADNSNSNKEQDLCHKRFNALHNKGTEALTRAYLDSCTNGIEVSDPKYYDDALLTQQLEIDRARLAALNAFDQATVKAGSVSGAALDGQGFGLSVQTPALPQIQSILAAGATSPVVTSTSGGPASPASNVPAPSLALPTTFNTSGFSNLEEQLQLQEEIASLSLLLEGAISDQLIQSKDGAVPRIKATIGIPILLNPPRRYRNAVAVVEVDVRASCGDAKRPCVTNSEGAEETKPTVLAVLPREKTYNVAALTDKNIVLSGGIVTNVVGVSGGFLHTHKTYYLVKDQDTLAGTFVTDRPEQDVGMWWFFRPVLGQPLVAAGPKQLLAQIGFPYSASPSRNRSLSLGTISMRSYWRKFDRKTGAVGDEIPGSFIEHLTLRSNIPELTLGKSLMTITHVDDLHDGNAYVSAAGTFPPGSSIRLGAHTYHDASTGLSIQNHNLGFSASLQDLTNLRPYLLYRDGAEEEISYKGCETLPQGSITALFSDDAHIVLKALLTNLAVEGESSPSYVFSTGSKTYATSITTTSSGMVWSAVIPADELNPEATVSFRQLLTKDHVQQNRSVPCAVEESVKSLGLPPGGKSAIFMGKVGDNANYVLYAPNLSCSKILFPKSATLTNSSSAPSNCSSAAPLARSDNEAAIVTISAADVGEDGAVVLLSAVDQLPYLVKLPGIPTKAKDDASAAPKAKERLTLGADDATITGAGLDPKLKVRFGDVSLKTEYKSGSLLVHGLAAAKITASPGSKELTLISNGKELTVVLDVVSARVETVSR